MTCTEVRRQLPAPSAQLGAQVEAHLDGCAPCRGEAESLREVERRLVRLGQARAHIAHAQRQQLDDALARQIGFAAPTLRLRQILRAPILLSLVLMAAGLVVLWLRLRHR